MGRQRERPGECAFPCLHCPSMLCTVPWTNPPQTSFAMSTPAAPQPHQHLLPLSPITVWGSFDISLQRGQHAMHDLTQSLRMWNFMRYLSCSMHSSKSTPIKP